MPMASPVCLASSSVNFLSALIGPSSRIAGGRLWPRRPRREPLTEARRQLPPFRRREPALAVHGLVLERGHATSEDHALHLLEFGLGPVPFGEVHDPPAVVDVVLDQP